MATLWLATSWAVVWMAPGVNERGRASEKQADGLILIRRGEEQIQRQRQRLRGSPHALWSRGGWAKAPRGGMGGGGGGGDEANLGGRAEGADDVRGGGKGGSHAGAAGRSTRSRTKEAVEFEERQTGVGITCRLFCASRRRTEKRWCQTEARASRGAVPVPVCGSQSQFLVWSQWMDGRQVRTGKDWYG